MFAFLKRTREMFPRSRELAYELVTLQKKYFFSIFFFFQLHYSLVKPEQPDW